jgi:hypothetical protein
MENVSVKLHVVARRWDGPGKPRAERDLPSTGAQTFTTGKSMSVAATWFT